MRAFAIDELGQPGSVHEVPDPIAGDGEVVVRVHAASINPFDAFVASGGAKAWSEYRFPVVPGIDAAGVVAAIGSGVTGLKAGDEVIASAAGKGFYGGGTFAELVAVPVGAVAKKPLTVGLLEAATLPLAGLTALAAAEVLNPQPSQTVAVVGATGAVGGFFVQIAAKRGASIVALARAKNFDYARSLGATEVVDHLADPVAAIHAAHPDGIDAIADFTGNATIVGGLSTVLKDGGQIASSASYGLDIAGYAGRGVTVNVVNALPLDRLSDVAALVDSGGIKPPTIQARPLDEAAEALAQVGERHNRGKVVLTIA